MHKHQRPKGTGPLTIPDEAVEAAAKVFDERFDIGQAFSPDSIRAMLEVAAPYMLAEAWEEAIQLADDEGCLLYHQTKGLKLANPYGTAR